MLTDKKKEIASERRRYVRIAPPRPIKIKYSFVRGYGAQGVYSADAMSNSVSGGGLFVEMPYLEPETVDELLKGEKKLALEIDLPNMKQPIKALGQVVWMEGKRDGKRYYYGAGVSFLRIDENDRDEIINYIIDLYLQKGQNK